MPSALPTELWIRILSLVADDRDVIPENLWLSVRTVSTTFKESIEAIFRDKYLPRTVITYNPTINYIDNDSEDGGDEWRPNKVVITPEFRFSHLSPDKSTAHFVVAAVHEKYKSLVVAELRDAIDGARFEKPAQVVFIGYDVNDTPIPGFSIDYDSLTISCDWRGLFSAFFAENALVEKLREEGFNQKRENFLKAAQGLAMSMTVSVKEVLRSLDAVADTARKRARRMRIREQYARDGYEDWQPKDCDAAEEGKILQSIKEEIHLARLQDLDDDGDSGDNDDAAAEEGFDVDGGDEHENEEQVYVGDDGFRSDVD